MLFFNLSKDSDNILIMWINLKKNSLTDLYNYQLSY